MNKINKKTFMIGISIFAISLGIAVNVGISSKKEQHLSSLSLANVEALARPIVGIDPETGLLMTYGNTSSIYEQNNTYIHMNSYFDQHIKVTIHKVDCWNPGSLTCPEEDFPKYDVDVVTCVGDDNPDHFY